MEEVNIKNFDFLQTSKEKPKIFLWFTKIRFQCNGQFKVRCKKKYAKIYLLEYFNFFLLFNLCNYFMTKNVDASNDCEVESSFY